MKEKYVWWLLAVLALIGVGVFVWITLPPLPNLRHLSIINRYKHAYATVSSNCIDELVDADHGNVNLDNIQIQECVFQNVQTAEAM